jgi:ketosteroid isomerase-like protein
MSPLLYQLSYRPAAGTLAILRGVSQENVEIVRSFHAAFAAGDRVEWRRDFAIDVVLDITRSAMPAAKVYRGHEGVEEFFRDWLGTWDDYHQETLDVVDAGDAVVVEFRQTGRGRTSGIEVDRLFYVVYELMQGKVVRFTLFDSREEALAAAGLPRA